MSQNPWNDPRDEFAPQPGGWTQPNPLPSGQAPNPWAIPPEPPRQNTSPNNSTRRASSRTARWAIPLAAVVISALIGVGIVAVPRLLTPPAAMSYISATDWSTRSTRLILISPSPKKSTKSIAEIARVPRNPAGRSRAITALSTAVRALSAPATSMRSLVH